MLSSPQQGFNRFAWITPFAASSAGDLAVVVLALSRDAAFLRARRQRLRPPTRSGRLARELAVGARLVTPVSIASSCGARLCAVAIFVAAPLFGAPETTAAAAVPSERDRWERQKRQALSAIKETELDHQMGKLSDEDYGRMRERFERQALDALTALDRGGRRG